MVIQHFNVKNIAVCKAKNNAPVGADRYGMKAFAVPFQWV